MNYSREMNKRIDDMVETITEMDLSAGELERIAEKHEHATTDVGIIIHTAAMLVSVRMILNEAKETV